MHPAFKASNIPPDDNKTSPPETRGRNFLPVSLPRGVCDDGADDGCAPMPQALFGGATRAMMSSARSADDHALRQQADEHVVGDLIKLFRGDRATLEAKREHLISHLLSCRECHAALGLMLKAGTQATGLSEAQHEKFAELYARLVRVIADPHREEAVALYHDFVNDWSATLRRPTENKYEPIIAHLRTCAACDRGVRSQFSVAVARRIAAEYQAHRKSAAPVPLPAAVPAADGDGEADQYQSWHDVLRFRAAPSFGMHLTDEYHTCEVVVDNWMQGELMLVLWGRDLLHNDKRRALTLLRPEYDRVPAARQAFVEAALDWCHIGPRHTSHSPRQLVRLPAFGDAPAVLCAYGSHTLRGVLTAAHQGKRDVTPAQAFTWATQTAATLVTLHGHQRHGTPHPLLHGDLKPANILIDDDDQSWLSQGGLHRVWSQLGDAIGPRVHHTGRNRAARAAGEEATITTLSAESVSGVPRVEAAHLAADPRVGTRGAVVGTPAYMAPERWLGVDAVEPASDIYAFGLVLYEIFTGAPGGAFVPAPHNANAWFRAHQFGPNRTLRSDEAHTLASGPLRHLLSDTTLGLTAGEREARARQLVNELSRLIDDCLAPLPQDRPTAAQVLDRLNLLARRLDPQRAQAPQRPAKVARAPQAADRAAHPSDPAQIGHLMRSYQHSREARDWAARVRTLLAQAEHAPLPEVWMAVAVALREQGEGELAQQALAAAEALASSPHVVIEPELHAIVSSHRGDIFAQQGKHREAVHEYRRSLEQRQEHVPTLVAKAFSLSCWASAPDATPEQRRQRLAEAQHDATHASRLEPHNPALRGFALRLTSGYARYAAPRDLPGGTP